MIGVGSNWIPLTQAQSDLVIVPFSYANFEPHSGQEFGMFLSGVTTDDCVIFFVYGYNEVTRVLNEIIYSDPDYAFGDLYADGQALEMLVTNLNPSPPCPGDVNFVLSDGGFIPYRSTISGIVRVRAIYVAAQGWQGAPFPSPAFCGIVYQFPVPVRIDNVQVLFSNNLSSNWDITVNTYNPAIVIPDGFSSNIHQTMTTHYTSSGNKISPVYTFDGTLVNSIVLAVSTNDGSGTSGIQEVIINCV